jgi:hypothetical protein
LHEQPISPGLETNPSLLAPRGDYRILAHVRTAISAAILRAEIHATKQNVSFRTYRRQEQTLTDLQIRQRKSNGRNSASNGGAAILKSPSLWETILGSRRVIV